MPNPQLPSDWRPEVINALAGFTISTTISELHRLGVPTTPESVKAIVVALRTTADIIEKHGTVVHPEHDLAAMTAEMALHERFHCLDVGLAPFATPGEAQS